MKNRVETDSFSLYIRNINYSFFKSLEVISILEGLSYHNLYCVSVFNNFLSLPTVLTCA